MDGERGRRKLQATHTCTMSVEAWTPYVPAFAFGGPWLRQPTAHHPAHPQRLHTAAPQAAWDWEQAVHQAHQAYQGSQA